MLIFDRDDVIWKVRKETYISNYPRNASPLSVLYDIILGGLKFVTDASKQFDELMNTITQFGNQGSTAEKVVMQLKKVVKQSLAYVIVMVA